MDVRVILTALTVSYTLRWHVFAHTRIALICNAPISNPVKIKERISAFPVLIAVDGGINHCHRLGLRPDLLIGDFDSANPDILKHFSKVPKKHFEKDKDLTDLELAMQLVFHSKIDEIVIFGALQGRTDHTLGNLILLCRYPGKVFLESDSERIFAVDRKAMFDTVPGQQISLIPMNGTVKGIHTQGLKWELKGKTMDKQFISISNEATSSQTTITVQEGDLLCCINY